METNDQILRDNKSMKTRPFVWISERDADHDKFGEFNPWRTHDQRRRIDMNNFVTKLTVRQLVGFGRFPYSKGRLTAEDEEIISRYIDFLGLRGLEGRYLDQLSGGQRQRAYVAMVLAQETDYVLLDEPLNNLDISHSVDMMRHLHDAAENLGRTIIVVLHDINFAARYADYICAVKDGQIVEFGPPKDVVRSDLLSSIFGTSIDVINTSRGPVAAYF